MSDGATHASHAVWPGLVALGVPALCVVVLAVPGSRVFFIFLIGPALLMVYALAAIWALAVAGVAVVKGDT